MPVKDCGKNPAGKGPRGLELEAEVIIQKIRSDKKKLFACKSFAMCEKNK